MVQINRGCYITKIKCHSKHKLIALTDIDLKYELENVEPCDSSIRKLVEERSRRRKKRREEKYA